MTKHGDVNTIFTEYLKCNFQTNKIKNCRKMSIILIELMRDEIYSLKIYHDVILIKITWNTTVMNIRIVNEYYFY